MTQLTHFTFIYFQNVLLQNRRFEDCDACDNRKLTNSPKEKKANKAREGKHKENLLKLLFVMVMVTELHHQESGSPVNGGTINRTIDSNLIKSCHYSNGKFSLCFMHHLAQFFQTTSHHLSRSIISLDVAFILNEPHHE